MSRSRRTQPPATEAIVLGALRSQNRRMAYRADTPELVHDLEHCPAMRHAPFHRGDLAPDLEPAAASTNNSPHPDGDLVGSLLRSSEIADPNRQLRDLQIVDQGDLGDPHGITPTKPGRPHPVRDSAVGSQRSPSPSPALGLVGEEDPAKFVTPQFAAHRLGQLVDDDDPTRILVRGRLRLDVILQFRCQFRR